ncbi:MAG: hypothetical protein IV100_25510, partial [Myxococcales bacterium]|nr:hypothetical protein [Myxococcales bacterium]
MLRSSQRSSQRSSLPLLALGLAVWALVTGMTGCGGSESFDKSQGAKLELVPNDAINVSIGQVGIGGTIDLPVKVRNLGNIPMSLQEVRLVYDANGAVDDLGAAFILAAAPGLPTSIEPFTGTAGIGEIEVVVRFTRQTSFASRVATLVVVTDAKFDGTASVPILEQPPAAVGSLSPEVIDFDTVELDTVAEKFAKMNSTGSEALVCDGFALRGHPDFTLHVGDQAYPVSEATLQRATIDPPLVVEPNTTTDLRITFAPTTESSAEGELILFCNDLQSATGGHSIVLLANQNVPCIEVTPLDMEFGGKIVGQIAQLPVSICSCGGSGLQITNIALDPARSEPDFQLSFASTGGGVGPNGIDPAAPLVLDFGDCIDVAVQYVPDVVSPLDADNRPIPDRAVLQIENDSFEPTVEVTVSGIGLEGTCPVPIIIVDEGEQVVPQTILHLDSNQSYSPNGAI